jgi:hypothetical protein
MHESSSLETTFGYLSAVHFPEHGYLGGYLIVCSLGRPLEFHFTAPILPSRAQQILYGPTLKPFLLGSQIGCTMLAAAQEKPRIILTDQPAFGSATTSEGTLLALIRAVKSDTSFHEEAASLGDDRDVHTWLGTNRADETRHWCDAFDVCGYSLQLACVSESERDAAQTLLTRLARHVALTEPFDRIHEAIREAHRIGAQNQDEHGRAA